jgi:hypothetical protein
MKEKGEKQTRTNWIKGNKQSKNQNQIRSSTTNNKQNKERKIKLGAGGSHL